MVAVVQRNGTPVGPLTGQNVLSLPSEDGASLLGAVASQDLAGQSLGSSCEGKAGPVSLEDGVLRLMCWIGISDKSQLPAFL